MTIGKRIKEARKLRGLTQKQLAEAAGIATGTIQQYELGKREPRSEILIKIARALKVSVESLYNTSLIPIDKLLPEVVESEINKTMHFHAYLNALGYVIYEDGGSGDLGYTFIENYSYDGNNAHTLIVDHNCSKLYLLDGDRHEYNVEKALETYAKFILDNLISEGTEVFDSANDGWLKNKKETPPADPEA